MATEDLAPGGGGWESGGQRGDRLFRAVLLGMGAVVVLLMALVVGACLRLSRPMLAQVGVWPFLLGRDWNPVAERYGALPFLYGTLVTSLLAVLLATPVALGVALFLTEMAPPRLRGVVSYLVEMLAAIPSVVYGLWGVMVLVPLLRDGVEPALSRALGFLPLFAGPPLGPGYLAAGLILALMILPTIASVTVQVLLQVPPLLREGALALGATRWEAIGLASLPFARRGILGAVLLGLARALGETMAVTMVIGNQPEIHASLFAPGYSVPSIIANEFAEATGPVHTGALAALALVLLVVTLSLSGAARLLLRLSRREPGGGP